MPSPFPGMDPYLEEPGLWPDVHHELISTIRELLNRDLRPKYHVRIEERVYLSDDDDPGRPVLIPDLRIAERPGWPGPRPPSRGSATLEWIEPIEAVTLIDDEIHEARLEVVDRSDRRVVTTIEILSPANKVSGARGHRNYMEKRQDVMHSPSHWVEIDLLRRGISPITGLRVMLPPHDYSVHVSRAERRPKGLIWPIRLDQRLPAVPIPLRTGDGDAPLDLQIALDVAYERAAYDLEVDYRAEASPPLAGEARAWADRLLSEKSLRERAH